MDKRKMYLMKRPENGVWYFRRPIPKELQPFVQSGNKQTITMSLKTKKLNEARQLHHEHWMESERVLAEARATAKAGGVANGGMAGKKATARALVTKRPLREFSKPELQGLVQRWYLRAMGDALERSRSMFNFGEPEERKRALAELDSELASLERREGAVLDVWTTPTKRAIIEAAGGYITAGHPGAFMETNMWFTAIVREALIRLNRYSFGIQQTGTPPSLEDSTPELSSSALVRVSNAAPSITLDELLEKFDKDPDRAHIKPKTRDEYRLVYAMLREAVGGSTPLASITREQIKWLQDVYRSLPAHFARLYPKKTLRQAAEQAKQDGRPPMERATFNKRMTLLSGVFLYAEK